MDGDGLVPGLLVAAGPGLGAAAHPEADNGLVTGDKHPGPGHGHQATLRLEAAGHTRHLEQVVHGLALVTHQLPGDLRHGVTGPRLALVLCRLPPRDGVRAPQAHSVRPDWNIIVW